MKQHLLLSVFVLFSTSLLAQIPRNNAGLFEYTQIITVDSSSTDILTHRAAKFFNRPMLVHWDSTFMANADNVLANAGDGYIEIGITSGLFGSRVKVGLQYVIIPKDNGYQYSIRHLTVRGEKGEVFPLEEKPEKMKYKYYDQVVNRTHRYLQRVIAYMKREMEGFR